MESYVDSVIYNEQGNEVKMVKKREKKSFLKKVKKYVK